MQLRNHNVFFFTEESASRGEARTGYILLGSRFQARGEAPQRGVTPEHLNQGKGPALKYATGSPISNNKPVTDKT